MSTAAPKPIEGMPAQPPVNRGQLARITVVAAAVFLLLRLLPTGTDLSHMDFRVDPKGGRAIEFCDPANPQFIPVVAVPSPVSLTLTMAEPPVAGRPVRGRVVLRTASGKPIAPADLLVTHTRRLHLLLVDPSLGDYQHLHPEPGGGVGEWEFGFTPARGGLYRIFGDFTPAATGRGLYASTDLVVAEGGVEGAADARRSGTVVERAGYRFSLAVPAPARAGRSLDLRFEISRPDGGKVPLELVMGAYAHLVAFDRDRTGFAHLHPAEDVAPVAPDAARPILNFRLTIPQAGSYVVWAQINLGGREEFVPFGLEVTE